MIFERTTATVSTTAALLLVLAGCAGEMSPSTPPAQRQSIAIRASTAACRPDFALSLSPSNATITSGQTVRVSVGLTSACGLSGTINVGIHAISPQPGQNNGFTFSQLRYDVPLPANGTASTTITFGATPSTLKTAYTVTIQGKVISGTCCHGLIHSAAFTLTVK